MAPAHEGLRDYAMLDITAETKAQVDAAVAIYDRRLSLLTTANERLESLLADGYPTLEIPPVDASVFADLTSNQATITAALAQFAVNEAVSVTIVPGVPELKA
jgi:hypothetical protein